MSEQFWCGVCGVCVCMCGVCVVCMCGVCVWCVCVWCVYVVYVWCVGRRRICRHNNGNNGARGAPGIIRE